MEVKKSRKKKKEIANRLKMKLLFLEMSPDIELDTVFSVQFVPVVYF